MTRFSISDLEIDNFRAVEHLEVPLHPELNVLLGDNGAGKSSLLDALSLMISRIFPSCDYQPRIKPLPFRLGDARVSSEMNRRGQWESVRCRESRIACKIGDIQLQMVRHHQSERVAVTGVGELVQMLEACRSAGELIPMFAHYGPHRGAEQGERKRFGRRKIDSSKPYAAYINALCPSLDFESFLDWFRETESAELRQQRKDKGYTDLELQVVRKALELFFERSEMHFTDPRFENNPMRFVMTCVNPDGSSLDLEFDQLSDGYRGMIALVADFARRLAILNRCCREGLDPLEGPGVLMIDEIDAHLHPKWQYRVLEDLHRTFPNVQLVVTTHSPEVVCSTPKDSVFILHHDADGVTVSQPDQQTQANYPTAIAEDVMGVPDMLAQQVPYQDYLRCLAAIAEGQEETEAFNDLFQSVLNHYGEGHDIVRELRARLEGQKRRRSLIERLRKESSREAH